MMYRQKQEKKTKQIVLFFRQCEDRCFIIGMGMGLFTGMMTAITSAQAVWICYGLLGGFAFGLFTGTAKILQKNF